MRRGKRNTRKGRGEHGGAMVEMVVLMLAVVPLVMLPMYFQDALRYKLDAQEAIYSTSWDFAYLDYQKKSAGGEAGRIAAQNQTIYANLWSGNDRPWKEYSGPWAHFKWNQELDCSADSSFAANYPMLAMALHNYVIKGGLASCKGRIEVANYYIPTIFMQDFENEDHFNQEKGQYLPYAEYNFGLMVDSWAISEKSDIHPMIPSPFHPFYERTAFVWMLPSTWRDMKDAWEDFADEMDDAVSKSRTTLETQLDHPMILKMAVKHLPDTTQLIGAAMGKFEWYVTSFLDGNGDIYKQTFDNRKEYYLGCQSFQPNCS